jgi:hypothetical protein
MSHTGYVHGLVDNNLTFKQFASTCAYAFGALMQYRDSNVDRTTLPDDVEKALKDDSMETYYEDQLKRETKEYNKLKAFTKKEREAFGKENRDKQLKENRESLKQALKEKKIVQDMLKKVEAWEPPTPDHVNYKKFMIDQLNMSTFMDDYYYSNVNKLEYTTPLQYYTEILKASKDQISFYKRQIKEQKAKKSVEKCGDWVKQLKESLENYE